MAWARPPASRTQARAAVSSAPRHLAGCHRGRGAGAGHGPRAPWAGPTRTACAPWTRSPHRRAPWTLTNSTRASRSTPCAATRRAVAGSSGISKARWATRGGASLTPTTRGGCQTRSTASSRPWRTASRAMQWGCPGTAFYIPPSHPCCCSSSACPAAPRWRAAGTARRPPGPGGARALSHRCSGTATPRAPAPAATRGAPSPPLALWS
mmetsp:Transcript_14250/g.41913  ORF Transcript_14250/g.41913 Transcript_14250/m.41913 type:complete len:209 (-) Transcript_14250:30-656(-)